MLIKPIKVSDKLSSVFGILEENECTFLIHIQLHILSSSQTNTVRLIILTY